MTLIGIIWAVFAPLSLVLVVWGICQIAKALRIPERFGIKETSARIFRLSTVSLLIIFTLLAAYIPQRLKFQRLCVERGTPTILRSEKADGFFLDDSTANSFGMRYLNEDGFAWLEARSIYHPKKFTRYEMKQGKIEEFEIEKTNAKYMVKSVFREEGAFALNELSVSRIDSGEKLAWAISMNFDGGIAKWILGAWGTASCPSAMTNPDAFRKMYKLAKETLNP